MISLLTWKRHLLFLTLLLPNAAFGASPIINVTAVVMASDYDTDHEVISPLQILKPALRQAKKHPLVRRALGNRISLVEEFVEFGCEHNVSLKRIIKLTCERTDLFNRDEPRFLVGVMCSYPLNNLHQYMLHPNDAVVSTGALSNTFDNVEQLIRIGMTANDLHHVLRAFMTRFGGWRNMFFMPRNTVKTPNPPQYYVDFLQCRLIHRAVEHQVKSEQGFRYEHEYVDLTFEDGSRRVDPDEFYGRILLERVSTKFSGKSGEDSS